MTSLQLLVLIAVVTALIFPRLTLWAFVAAGMAAFGLVFTLVYLAIAWLIAACAFARGFAAGAAAELRRLRGKA